MAPRTLLRDTCTLAAEILDGKHDAELDWIVQAAQARIKQRFRRGSRVRLTGTRNPELEGKIGTVLKVNQKRISVGVGDPQVEGRGTPWEYTTYTGGEYNVPPSMLEAVN